MRLAGLAHIVIAATLGIGMVPAAGQEFYKGKTVNILVGFSAGGGFDINARMLARHLGQHLPGKPEVVVTNMPGAASFTALQYLETRAPKDGTFIATFNFSLIADSKLFPERVNADFRKYAWVGSVAQDISSCYTWGALGIHNLDDARKHGEINMGDIGPGVNAYVQQNILKKIFGVKVKQVLGYAGSADQRVAIERGELDGDCGAWTSLPLDWIDGHKVNPLMRSAPAIAEGMPPETPYMVDIAPDERSRQIIQLLVATGQVGRPFIAASGVPADRIEMLRKAFDETMADPEFVADARKIRQPTSPKNAAEALKIVEGVYSAPDDIVKAAREIAGG